MLEQFEIKGNLNRRKVVQYLKNSKIDLSKFTIQENKDYPGGLELVDSKKRKIVIYDDYLTKEIRVIYKDLNRSKQKLEADIALFSWDSYLEIANKLHQTVRIEQLDEKHIRFIRTIKYEDGAAEKVHTSQIFDPNSDLYDIYEYFDKESELMVKQMQKVEV